MKLSLAIVSATLLAFPALCAAQSAQPKTTTKKATAKSTAPSAKPADTPPKNLYAELTIGELVAEDANRWSDKMSARIALGGFVTQIAKADDGAVSWPSASPSCLAMRRRSAGQLPSRASPATTPRSARTGGRSSPSRKSKNS
jgi:hypothetical protein